MSWGEKGLYREVCPEGVQNKCPGGYGAEVKDHVLGGGGGKGCTEKCVQRGSKINVLGGYGAEVKDHVLGGKELYREVCPEGVQNKCPEGGMV